MQAMNTLIERHLARLDTIAKEAACYVSALDKMLWDLSDPVNGPRLIRTFRPFALDSEEFENGLEALIGISEGPKHLQTRTRRYAPNIRLRVRVGSEADATFRGWMDMFSSISPEYMRRLCVSTPVLEKVFPSQITQAPQAEHAVWTLSCDLIRVPEF